MTTQFLTYGVAPTGAPIARTVPNRFADIINVKDYGAIGNGLTDDLAALHLAVNAAFGTFDLPNAANFFLNKPLYFPPGHYIISNTLQLPAINGGLIAGAGKDATTIECTAPGATVVKTDGFTYSSLEGIAFKGINGGSAIGFDWRKTTHGIVGNQLCVFMDCAFDGCNAGLSCGLPDGSAQSDTSLFINNRFTNNDYGLVVQNQNAIAHTVIGGTFINNGYGIHNGPGAIGSIRGCNFSGSINYDIAVTGTVNDCTHIAGCVSTSDNFVIDSGLNSVIIEGCKHIGANNGNFLSMSAQPFIIKGCYSSKGRIYFSHGATLARVMNSTFSRSDWYGYNDGDIHSPGDGSVSGGFFEIENLTFGPTPTQLLRQRIYWLPGPSAPAPPQTVVTENYKVVP